MRSDVVGNPMCDWGIFVLRQNREYSEYIDNVMRQDITMHILVYDTMQVRQHIGLL